MKQEISDKMSDERGFDTTKIETIHNWEDELFIQPVPKSENAFAKEHNTIEPFTIVYSGNIGQFHELETVINAVDCLDSRGYSIKFLIIGEGACKSDLQEYVTQNNISAVDFLPFQPLDRLPESLTCGNISLVGIKEGMQGLCVSSKLYSSLAAGQPILAVVGEGDEVATVVRNCDCGRHVEPNNITQCANIIEGWIKNPELREQHGRNARTCFENRFTFENARDRYAEVLRDITIDRPDS
jgi:glycosyltransferase involved in cell wall biosynthesis